MEHLEECCRAEVVGSVRHRIQLSNEELNYLLSREMPFGIACVCREVQLSNSLFGTIGRDWVSPRKRIELRAQTIEFVLENRRLKFEKAEWEQREREERARMNCNRETCEGAKLIRIDFENRRRVD